MLELERLDVKSLLKVIDLVVVFRDANRDSVLTEIAKMGSDRVEEGSEKRPRYGISASSLSRRKSFPPEFLRNLESYVLLLPEAERSAVLSYVSAVTDTDRPSLRSDFEGWIDYADVTSESFVQRCTNENGQYLIFRSPGNNLVEVARMTIVFDKSRNRIPSFETSFYVGRHSKEIGSEDNLVPQSMVRGLIFEVGNYAYAIGKSVNNRAMRFSKLRPNTRPGGETDLYGIRVANSTSVNRPYAHFIYCYQLKRPRFQSVMQKLLTVSEINDDLLDQEIDEISEIRALLQDTQVEENGLVSKPFGEQ